MKIGDPLDRSTDHGPQNHKYVHSTFWSFVFNNERPYFMISLNLIVKHCVV